MRRSAFRPLLLALALALALTCLCGHGTVASASGRRQELRAGAALSSQSSHTAGLTTAAALLSSRQIVGGCVSPLTCCNGKKCPYDGGVCCEDNHSCCPSDMVCVPPKPADAMRGAPMRCNFPPPPDECDCDSAQSSAKEKEKRQQREKEEAAERARACPCHKEKRLKNEAVVHYVRNLTNELINDPTNNEGTDMNNNDDDDDDDDDDNAANGHHMHLAVMNKDADSFFSLLSVKDSGDNSTAASTNNNNNNNNSSTAAPIASSFPPSNASKPNPNVHVVPMIVALPTPPQPPLDRQVEVDDKLNQQKRIQFEIYERRRKEDVKSEEFFKTMKRKDSEMATKADVVRYLREDQFKKKQQQLSQLQKEQSDLNLQQMKHDMSTVTNLHKQFVGQQAAQQQTIAEAIYSYKPSYNKNKKIVKKEKKKQQQRRNQEIYQVYREIAELKKDLKVMRQMKKTKENYDRIHVIKAFTGEIKSIRQQIKQYAKQQEEFGTRTAKQMRALKSQWDDELYRAQTKKLEKEIAKKEHRLIRAESLVNVTKAMEAFN